MAGLSELGKIGTNSVNEIFEDLTYNLAYNEIHERLNSYIEMDNKAFEEAIKSGLSVAFSGVLMLYISKQEEIINSVTNKTLIVVLSLLSFGLSPIKKIKNKIGNRFKGRKLTRIFEFFSNTQNNNLERANTVLRGADLIHQAQQAGNLSQYRISTFNSQKAEFRENEAHKLEYAKAKAEGAYRNILLKILTKNFTKQDETIIKHILGRNFKPEQIKDDDLNKIANFMYVQDSEGEITGLSEQFMTMINGLGYFKGKGAKNG